jgi:V8-like Glu-specific endopeptidase
MGTTESKIKNGYLLKSSPIFSNKQKEGVKPNEKSTFIREHAACRELNKTSSSEQEESEILADSIVELKKPSSSSAKIISENFEYPYSSIGLVSCLLGDQKVIGTGCLIGPNFVLTCAHNVWSFREKRLGKNIIFSPAF